MFETLCEMMQPRVTSAVWLKGFGTGAMRVIVAVAMALACASCSFIPRDTFTASEQSIAQVPGMPNVRFYADASSAELRAFESRWNLKTAINATGRFDILALSGGGYDGAYGAGVLAGWTASGTRPRFTIVTGVSAGALIAPLAFVGPEYDRELQEAFTGGLSQVLGDIGGLSLLGGADVRRSSLIDIISKFVDQRLLRAVAIESAKGRHLLIVTTNLDAQRAVVWDMGAIAASGHPDARRLFIEVLAASASIPGVFAPALIEVEARDTGRRFKELHVDGGATTQVFVVPDAVLVSGVGIAKPAGAKTHVWVVMNNRLTPQFEVVEGGILPIASRSFSTLIKSEAKSTLLATAAFVGKGNFNLTYIDDGVNAFIKENTPPGTTPGFNTAYMHAVFQYGYRKALTSAHWEKQVPVPEGMKARVRAIAASMR